MLFSIAVGYTIVAFYDLVALFVPLPCVKDMNLESMNSLSSFSNKECHVITIKILNMITVTRIFIERVTPMRIITMGRIINGTPHVRLGSIIFAFGTGLNFLEQNHNTTESIAVRKLHTIAAPVIPPFAMPNHRRKK
jgi:predicted Kef-type K+ transport protein